MKPEGDTRAGLIETRRARQTKRMVSLYKTAEAGMDSNGGAMPYSIVCEEHGSITGVSTLKLARWHLPDPLGWCEACAAEAR